MRANDFAALEEAHLPVSGEALTRRAITVITASIVALTFAFSLGNVTRLCMDLGIIGWIAWLVGPAVDLSVIGLLTGIRFLSLHGYDDEQLRKPRRLLRFCGVLTLALNTAGALGQHQFGTALVDAVGPALLIGWSEVGPWMLRQVYAVCSAAAPAQQEARPTAVVPPVFPVGLLAQARKLDAEHRTTTGRPISRDALRAQLRIGRDRASALIAVVRTEGRNRDRAWMATNSSGLEMLVRSPLAEQDLPPMVPDVPHARRGRVRARRRAAPPP